MNIETAIRQETEKLISGIFEALRSVPLGELAEAVAEEKPISRKKAMAEVLRAAHVPKITEDTILIRRCERKDGGTYHRCYIHGKCYTKAKSEDLEEIIKSKGYKVAK